MTRRVPHTSHELPGSEDGRMAGKFVTHPISNLSFEQLAQDMVFEPPREEPEKADTIVDVSKQLIPEHPNGRCG